jgi:hypothetical protein
MTYISGERIIEIISILRGEKFGRHDATDGSA